LSPSSETRGFLTKPGAKILVLRLSELKQATKKCVPS
jgi:hypothetical protein